MSSEDGGKSETQQKSRISYTREFLLSLSELDACKKLPRGFDALILSEFGDASGSGFVRQWGLGGLSEQSSRRGEYGSVLQNRPESSGSYGRGNQGRWDTRSSGSNDKEGDLKSDRDSAVQDPGRQFGSQNRRSWQNSEHDGLLGSGAFPRPPGYAGPSGSKAQGTGPYQLKRSTEPYQPPRPYKSAPYSRKDSTDSYNDETFGSTDCSTEDRAEEERKRRESFELMRKEQHKALQEKQKQNFGNPDADIMALLGNSANDHSIKNENNSDESTVNSVSHSDPSRSTSHLQAPASRPLVPPGFRSAVVEKNSSIQFSSASLALEGAGAIIENKQSLSSLGNGQDAEKALAAGIAVDIEKNAPNTSSRLFVDANERLTSPALSAEKLTAGCQNLSGKTTIQGATEIWQDDIVIVNDSSCMKESSSQIAETVNQDHTTTVLEKLFSSALSRNCASLSNSIEHQVVQNEKECRSAVFESSKYARWFSEEKKPEEDFSSRKLLSLIINNEQAGSQGSTFSEDSREQIPLNINFETVVASQKFTTSPATSVIGVPDQYAQADDKGRSSVVLTCEDLEQSILADVEDSNPNMQQAVQGSRSSVDGKSEKQKTDVDDHASQHLLSLLQMGTSLKGSLSSPGADLNESPGLFSGSHVKHNFDHTSDNAPVQNAEVASSSQQTLTLEALFGASFMNALHSAEAPVSAQRGSVGTGNDNDVGQPHGVSLTRVGGDILSVSSHELRSDKVIHESDLLAMSNTQKGHNIQNSWNDGYADHSVEPSNLGDIGIEEIRNVDIQLPEEDSLITVGDTLNPIPADPFTCEDARKICDELFPVNKNVERFHFQTSDQSAKNNNAEGLSDKFLNTIFRDGERARTQVSDVAMQLQKGPSPFEMVDPNDLYRHLRGRPSSQMHHQVDQTRPTFQPAEHLAHRNPQMKFAGPDGMHHDPHPMFPGNLIPHHALSNIGAPRFDPAAAHPMLQHVSDPGNFSHHPMQGLPRGLPLSYPVNHMPGHVADINSMHNFRLHDRQPSYGGGLGMGLPGPVALGGGDTHSEAFERLIEMEMRANSKQIHPRVAAHIPGIYGPDNMNFRYR